jgi:uncharacterized protein (TIGR03086 family)
MAGSAVEDADMDTNQTTPASTTAAAPDESLAEDDPRLGFARAVATARGVIAGVRPDQMGRPTPCDGFAVRGLLGHLTAVLHRVAAIGRGEGPFATPDQVDEAPGDDWGAAWVAAAHEVQAAWDAEVLDREVQVPWTTMSGRDAMGIYTNEVVVHTWDVARATGQDPRWEASTLEVALGAAHAQMPAEGRHEMFAAVRAALGGEEGDDWPDPFLAVVPVPPDASLIDRLVAYNGRSPSWLPDA